LFSKLSKVARKLPRLVVEVVHDARCRWEEMRDESRLEPLTKRLNDVVLRLNDDLVDAKKHVASAIAGEKRLAKHIEQERACVIEWEARVQKALELGDEQLAEEAIAHQREHAALRDDFETVWKGQVEVVEKLKARLRLLIDVIEGTKRKKNSVLARNFQGEAQHALDRLELALNRARETLSELEARVTNPR
jgi:phage shock protein A